MSFAATAIYPSSTCFLYEICAEDLCSRPSIGKAV